MRIRMNGLLASLAVGTLTSWLLEGPVLAAEPTTSECLAASSASLQSAADHKLRLERDQLHVCAATSCPAVVRKECLSRTDEVNAQIPTIVFEVKDAKGNELSAVKVTMDGEVVADRLDGSALTLDPGSHSFMFEAAGQPTTTQQILLHEGDKNRQVAVTLTSSTIQPQPVPTPVAPPSPTPPPSTPDSTSTNPSDGGHGRRVLGLAIGGAGVAGVVVGAIFGGLQLSEVSTTKSACPTLVNCSSQALNDRSTALTYGNVSTGALIAGGVLLAGGVAVYFTAPKGTAPTVGLQVGPGTLGVRATF